MRPYVSKQNEIPQNSYICPAEKMRGRKIILQTQTAVEYKDYYKVLGITKTATAEEIKKAFRLLAIKYHPDKNPDNKLSEDKFKEVTEANNVLGDPEKRKKYDDLGANWNQAQQGGSYQQYSRRRGGQGNPGGNFSDDNNFSDFFDSFFGNGFSQQRPQRQAPRDLKAELEISLEDAYHGTSRRLDVDGHVIEIKIKPGVKDRQVLRVKAKGNNPNDIYLTILVPVHPHYERKMDDLYCDVPVNLYQAVLGGKIPVNTLKGPIHINIPKETANGKTLRLKGMGMPVFGKEEFGNLFAKVAVVLPEKLSEKEIQLFTELRDQ